MKFLVFSETSSIFYHIFYRFQPFFVKICNKINYLFFTTPQVGDYPLIFRLYSIILHYISYLLYSNRTDILPSVIFRCCLPVFPQQRNSDHTDRNVCISKCICHKLRSDNITQPYTFFNKYKSNNAFDKICCLHKCIDCKYRKCGKTTERKRHRYTHYPNKYTVKQKCNDRSATGTQCKIRGMQNAFCGIKMAVIMIKYFASSLASAFVLYRFGNNGDSTSIAKATIVQQNTENAIILLSVSRASFILPAPSSCPTTMATESPRAMNTILNTLFTVFEIFRPATTFNPRIE